MHLPTFSIQICGDSLFLTIMTIPILALELVYLIIDQVLETELQHYQHVFAPSAASTAFELLATSHTIRNYLMQQDRFHRLRLWRLLNRIPRQFEPVQIAVGNKDAFTVLSIDMSTEKITNVPQAALLGNDSGMTETFLVLQETSSSIRAYRAQDDYLVYTKSRTSTSGWGGGSQNGSLPRTMTATSLAAASTGVVAVSSSSTSTSTTSGCGSGFLKGKKAKKDTNGMTNGANIGLYSTTCANVNGDNNNNNRSSNSNSNDNIDSSGRITLALFPLSTFLRHVKWYALHHDASVWLWKRSTRFFKGDNLDLLLQQRFRYILDTPRHALIAWDRPYQDNFRFTENVLNSNVELFSKLLPSF
ncbi:unnamed protein product [Absidia cylindrospora]